MNKQQGTCAYCARLLDVRDLYVDRRGNLVCVCGELLGREEDRVERPDGTIVFDAGRSVERPPGVDAYVEEAGRDAGYRAGPTAKESRASFPDRHSGLGQVSAGVALVLLATTGGLLWHSGGDLAAAGGVLPALFAIYVALGAFLNRIELSVSKAQVRVRTAPFPLPTRSSSLTVDAADLEQINCRQDSTTTPGYDLRAVGGFGEVGPSEDVSYSVLAVGRTKATTVVQGLRDANTALAIAYTLRAGLGLAPGPSDGAHARSLRAGSASLGERSSNKKKKKKRKPSTP